jgi:hypothetical protein
MFSADAIVFSNIFDQWLVDSMDTELWYREG